MCEFVCQPEQVDVLNPKLSASKSGIIPRCGIASCCDGRTHLESSTGGTRCISCGLCGLLQLEGRQSPTSTIIGKARRTGGARKPYTYERGAGY
jgi:hypothetical protein